MAFVVVWCVVIISEAAALDLQIWAHWPLSLSARRKKEASFAPNTNCASIQRTDRSISFCCSVHLTLFYVEVLFESNNSIDEVKKLKERKVWAHDVVIMNHRLQLHFGNCLLFYHTHWVEEWCEFLSTFLYGILWTWTPVQSIWEIYEIQLASKCCIWSVDCLIIVVTEPLYAEARNQRKLMAITSEESYHSERFFPSVHLIQNDFASHLCCMSAYKIDEYGYWILNAVYC